MNVWERTERDMVRKGLPALGIMALIGFGALWLGRDRVATPVAAIPQHCKPGSVRAYSGINMDGQRFICVPGYYPESQNP